MCVPGIQKWRAEKEVRRNACIPVELNFISALQRFGVISKRLRGARDKNVSHVRKSEYPPVQLFDISKTDLKHGIWVHACRERDGDKVRGREVVSCSSDQAVFIDRV